MRGDKEYLTRMLGRDDTFIIPVYQRNYDWKQEHCKQLYNDLISTIKNDKPSHFFGSIVTANSPRGSRNHFIIIDGQQRITTVSLLFLAIHDILKKGTLTSADPKLQERIYKKFLIDQFDEKIKLIPAANSKKAYYTLLDGNEDDFILDSKITANYQYYYDRILSQEISIDELIEAIDRLVVIDIFLESGDDAQLIFESLNSTGLELSESDKIRNYVLMALPLDIQERYYNQYWDKIEQYTNKRTDFFVRDYLTLKLGKIPTLNKIYTDFKAYAEPINKETLLSEMTVFSKYYNMIYSLEKANSSLQEPLRRLRKLDISVLDPYVMNILHSTLTEKYLSISDAVSTLDIIENYLSRRMVCGAPTNALNKVFMTLHKDVLRQKGNDVNYVEKLKYVLLSKQGLARFPTDAELRENLCNRNIYQDMKGSYQLYLLERLENQDNYEVIDLQQLTKDGKLSIEHIMPQTLSEQWIEDLGGEENAQNVYEKWLHKLANLTLTAYNSKYSNNPFLKKRDMDKGFGDSHLKLNHYIAECEKWSEAELTERNQQLIDLSLKIWPSFVSSFVPEVKSDNIYHLDEDIDFTGREIISFNFEGTEYKVSSWKEFYVQILEMLHKNDPTILKDLAMGDLNDGLTSQFLMNAEKYPSSDTGKVADGIYVWTHNLTRIKIATLLKCMERFGVSPSEIRVSVSKAPDLNQNSETHEKNFKFWIMLLNEMNLKTSLFSNRSPARDTWLTAGANFGSGFEYYLIFNKKECKIGFQCYSSDPIKNKNLYDFIYSRKDLIESKSKSSIIWNRGDNVRLSTISIGKTYIDTRDENVWSDIVPFMVENMVTFSESLNPILEEYKQISN